MSNPSKVVATCRIGATALFAGLLLLTGGAVAHAQQGDPQAPSPVTESSRGNTVQAGQMMFHQGMRDLDRANDLAKKAAAMDDSAKAEKLLQKSVKACESAVQQLTQSLQASPQNIEGYVGLGQAFRHLGKYEEALEVHAIALRRDPDSMDNFRGWSEALMQLNMLGNATQAYATYVEEGPPRAPILMDEIKKWLVVRQADPGELDPEHIDRMAQWIAEQNQGS